MVYMGSKAGMADWLVPFLQKIIDEKKIKVYWEPFVGGANIIDKINCKKRVGTDKSKTLIELLKKAQSNIEEIPLDCSREDFELARKIYRRESTESMPLWQIGAYQWLGSYGTRGFPGGFAPPKNGRIPYHQRLNNLKAQAPFLKDIIFYSGDFQEAGKDINNALILCDPPYLGTKPYGYAYESKFDYEVYWEWVREKSKTNWVVCCEETFPSDFKIITSTTKRRTQDTKNKKVAIEKIGVWKEGLLKEFCVS